MKTRRILQKVSDLMCCHFLLASLRAVDATALDIWVLDQLRSLLHNATENASLDSQLRQDKTVFFLHLLGLSTLR